VTTAPPPPAEALAAHPALPPTGTYTVENIAKLTQSSARHIWRLVDRGVIPGRIKGLGRLVRFSKSAVDAWLSGQKPGRA
jgi:excisionase family DNA binding protein